MASIGTAYINIAPNMSGIQGKIASGIKGLGSQPGEQLGDEIGKGASTKLAALSGVVAGATSALVSKGLDLASKAISDFVANASDIQSLRASFESLTGSADKTNQVMTTLYNFGKQTAFSNKDIQSAGRSFLSVGQDATQMQESLKLAGDIAGATGADLTQLVLPLSQAYARGSLQTQDFYQILNAGGGALRGTLQEVVKNATGISDLGTAMSDGKVTTDLLWQAMRQATAQGGFAFDGAIKQSETFNGRMSNLQESITNAGLALLGVNAATGEIDPSGAFAKFSGIVQGLVDYLGSPAAQAGIQNIATQVSNMIKGLSGMVDFVVKNKDIFAPIAVGVGVLVAAILGLIVVTTIMTAVTTALGVAFASTGIGLLVIGIAALVAGIIFFFTQTKLGKEVWANFMSFLGGVWANLQAGFAAVGKFFGDIWTSISGAITGVINTIGGAVNGVVGFFSGIFTAISSAVNAFLGFFGEHWRIIIAIVLGPLGLLIDFVTAYWSEITGAISTAINFIWGIITTVFNNIVSFLVSVFTPIINIYVTIFTTIWQAIFTAVNWIWNTITSVFNAVVGFLSSVLGPPINAMIGVFQQLAGTIGNIIGGLWNGITGTFNNVVNFLGGIGSKIMGIFQGAGGWLVDTGKNIINGLINGASGLLSNIGNLFLKIVPGWIQEPFKKALGIHSPSRVFAGFGDNITQGLINGVTDNVSGVAGAVGTITDAAMIPIANINPTVTVAGAVAAATPGAGAGDHSSTTVHIDTFNAGGAEGVKEFFNQLNQDTINVGMGLTANQGSI